MHVLGILVRLAWRNLWRNHRRTLIMLMAVTLGTWAMIFMTALMRGMVTEVSSRARSPLGTTSEYTGTALPRPSSFSSSSSIETERSGALELPF